MRSLRELELKSYNSLMDEQTVNSSCMCEGDFFPISEKARQ